MEDMDKKIKLAKLGTEFIFERFELDWYDAYENFSDEERREWFSKMVGAMTVFMTFPLIDEDMLTSLLTTYEKSLL